MQPWTPQSRVVLGQRPVASRSTLTGAACDRTTNRRDNRTKRRTDEKRRDIAGSHRERRRKRRCDEERRTVERSKRG
jgi:sRNA-binding protein